MSTNDGAMAGGMTTAFLVLIAIGMVLAVWMMLRRSRRAKGNRPTEYHPASAPDEPTPDETQEALAADEPIAAAAPLDASPATLAADLAAPPAEAPPRIDALPLPEPATVAQPPAPPVAPPGVETDDLTRIKGLGPRLAVTLGELGITRYAQIADLTPEQARDLDARLGAFQGRMERDRWIEQAGYLARGDRDGFEAAFGKL